MLKAEAACPVVLIADDEEGVRRSLCALMQREGFQALEAQDGEAALDIIRRERVDLALLDVRLPGVDGMRVLAEARKIRPAPPVILMTGFGCIESAVEAIKSGAWDYLTKPFNNEGLCATVRAAVRSRSRLHSGLHTRASLGSGAALLSSMGSSAQIASVTADIELVAPTDFTVLIQGETGTGKEVVAQAIHHLSPRSRGSFVPVDCGSIPPTLIESELFGHEKGSYTGAHRSHPGKFEVASGGTLLLDEISNLPLSVQPKLLRALQEKKIWRVGATDSREVDIRVVAATNQDLASMVKAKRFRRDLYYRLNEFSITVPPLRERPDDTAYLAQGFFELTREELKKEVKGFTDEALQVLLSYQWPGNVRELRNVVRRAVLRCNGMIRPEDLDPCCAPSRLELPPMDASRRLEGELPLKQIVRNAVNQVERDIIARVLRQTRWNKAEAARILKLDYKTLHNKVKQYQITHS